MDGRMDGWSPPQVRPVKVLSASTDSAVGACCSETCGRTANNTLQTHLGAGLRGAGPLIGQTGRGKTRKQSLVRFLSEPGAKEKRAATAGIFFPHMASGR